MSLDERKKRILEAVINSYIETAEPVSSRTISKYYIPDLSSATLRNEMADLEELGYLEQPHTSAGRVPTHKGYRFYVDFLMRRYRLSMEEMENLKNSLVTRAGELERIMEHATHIISDITNYTSIVTTSSAKTTTIRKIEIVPVDERVFVMIIALSNGMLKNRIFHSRAPISYQTVSAFCQLLNATVVNRSLHEITWDKILSLQYIMPQHADLIEPVLKFAGESIAQLEEDEVYLWGMQKILEQPEFSDLVKAKEFFQMIDSRSYLSSVPSTEELEKTKIIIGNEQNSLPVENTSIIICRYEAGREMSGTVSIIGPTRMDYPKVVSHLEYFAKILGNLLKNKPYNEDDTEV